MNPNLRKLTAAAIVGAAYAALTIALAPISYGAIQCRISEVLCILPYFLPFTAWGLFAGCLASNFITGNIMDIVFGSLATLAAAWCTAAIGRHGNPERTGRCALACLMPVLWNGVVVGAVITKGYAGLDLFANFPVFALNAVQVAAGESVVLYVLGLPCMKVLPKKEFFRRICASYGGKAGKPGETVS